MMTNEVPEYPSPSFRWIAVLALCVGVGAGVWAFAALILPSMGDDGKTVYIAADKSPIKVPPNEPGGMEIPHQDKLVFNAVSGSAKVNPPERIAPPPEQPVYSNSSAPAAPAIQSGTPSRESLIGNPSAQPAANPPSANANTSKAPQPVALGRSVEPPGTPAPAAGAPVKAAELATSFDMGKTDAPPPVARMAARPAKPAKPIQSPLPVGSESANLAAVPAPEEPEVKQEVTEARVNQGVVETQAPSQDNPVSVEKADTPGEKPVLPSAEKVAANDNPAPAVEDQDTAAADEELGTSSSESAAASSPEDEPVTYQPSGAIRYQLASYTDRASAQHALSKLASKYSDVISKSSLTVVAARAKGHQVYRIQGSATSKDEARAICGRVKAQGGSCVLAR